jgi:hypothetical protein
LSIGQLFKRISSNGSESGSQKPERVKPGRPQFGPGQCAYPRCPEQKGWRCSYRDKTGRQCEMRWCDKHVELVGDRPYCQRHAAVVEALEETEGSILEVKSQPAVDDRAVPLLNLIVNEIDQPVLGALKSSVRGHDGLQVARQRTVQEVFVDQERAAWQVAWGVNNSRGYLLKAAVRVGVTEPPVVQGVVANHVVFQDVPYWIKRRRNGEQAQPGDHKDFFKNLSSAISEAVDTAVPQVMQQLEVESERFGSMPVRRY